MASDVSSRRLTRSEQVGVGQALVELDRHLRTGRQAGGQCFCLGRQSLLRVDVIAQSELQGLSGGHDVTGQQVLLAPVQSEQQGPQDGATVAGHDSRLHVRVGDTGVLGQSTMSQNRAIVAPSPMASPLTAAMIGCGMASWARTIRLEPSMRWG